jgi:hypothetical protein
MKTTLLILFVMASLSPAFGSAESSDDYTLHQDIAYLGPDRAEKWTRSAIRPWPLSSREIGSESHYTN